MRAATDLFAGIGVLVAALCLLTLSFNGGSILSTLLSSFSRWRGRSSRSCWPRSRRILSGPDSASISALRPRLDALLSRAGDLRRISAFRDFVLEAPSLRPGGGQERSEAPSPAPPPPSGIAVLRPLRAVPGGDPPLPGPRALPEGPSLRPGGASGGSGEAPPAPPPRGGIAPPAASQPRPRPRAIRPPGGRG